MATSARNPALAVPDEFPQLANFAAICKCGFQFLACLRGVQVGAVDDAISFCEFAKGFAWEARTLQAHFVDSADFGRIAVGNHERRDVLNNFRAAACDGMAANPAELMDGSEPANDGMVAHFHMAGQSAVVGENDVVTNAAVVRNMAVGEEMPSASDNGLVLWHRSAIYGAVLAEGVVIADAQPRWFMLIFEILGALANGAERVKFVALPNNCGAIDDNVALQPASRTKRDGAENKAVRPDFGILGKLGACVDDGGGMDAAHERLGVDQREGKLALGHNGVVHKALAGSFAKIAAGAGKFAVDEESIAGHYGFTEFYAIGGHKITDFAAVLGVAQQQDAGDLGHGLNLKHARHHGVAREMPWKIRLIKGHRLDAATFVVAFKSDNAIYHEERIAVWQDSHNLIDVEHRFSPRDVVLGNHHANFLKTGFDGADQLRVWPVARSNCDDVPTDRLAQKHEVANDVEDLMTDKFVRESHRFFADYRVALDDNRVLKTAAFDEAFLH